MEDYTVKILHQFGLTEEMVRDHVLRPDNNGAVTQYPTRDFTLQAPADHGPDIPPGPKGWFYHLEVQQLRSDLHDMLSRCTVGYSMQLRQHGRVLFDDPWGFSKMPGDGNPAGVRWNADTPMHIASVSKLFTAMAMTKLLWSRNISMDWPIWPYLPKYWTRGEGVDQITFRDLLNHKSGLIVPAPPGLCDYLFMKNTIAAGGRGLPGYLNINYALCRILISTIDAPYLFNLLPTTDDKYWDLTTTNYYVKYVNDNIFAPAGVSSTMLHTDPNALAYPIPGALPGWNSGDRSTMSGAIGWHLSVNELLTVMSIFLRSGAIIDSYRAQRMLDWQFGIDQIREPKLGRIYAKGGFWGNGSAVEQSNVFFLPKGMELAILCNSPFCSPGTNFMDKVLGKIEQNIALNLFTVTAVTALSAMATVGLIRKSRTVKRPG